MATEADIREPKSETSRAEKETQMLTEASNVVIDKSVGVAEPLPDKHVDIMRKHFEVEDTREAIEGNIGNIEGENIYESPSVAKVAGEQIISLSELNEAVKVLNETESKFSQSSLGKETEDNHVEIISTIKENSAEEIQHISKETLGGWDKELNGRIEPGDNADLSEANSSQSAEGDVYEPDLAEKMKVECVREACNTYDSTEKIPTIEPASSTEDLCKATFSEEGSRHTISERRDEEESEKPFISEGKNTDREEMKSIADMKDEDTNKETISCDATENVTSKSENSSDRNEEATEICENANRKLGGPLTITSIEETCLPKAGSDDIYSEAVKSSDHLTNEHNTEAEASPDGNQHASITTQSFSPNEQNAETHSSKNELLDNPLIADVRSNKDEKLKENTNSTFEKKSPDASELSKNISDITSEECDIQSTNTSGYSGIESEDVSFQKVEKPLSSSTSTGEYRDEERSTVAYEVHTEVEELRKFKDDETFLLNQTTQMNPEEPLYVAPDEINVSASCQNTETPTTIEKQRSNVTLPEVAKEGGKDETVDADYTQEKQTSEGKNVSTVDLNVEEDGDILCNTAKDLQSTFPLVEETKQEQVCEENQVPIKEPKHVHDAHEAKSIPESSSFRQTLAEGASDMDLTSTSQMDADKLETESKLNFPEKLQINAEDNTEDKLQQHGEASEEQDHEAPNAIENTIHGSETTFDASSVTNSEVACLHEEESSTPELKFESLKEMQDGSRIEAKEKEYLAEETSEVQPQQSVHEIQFSDSQSVENDKSVETGAEKTFTDDHSLSSESSKKDADDLAISYSTDKEILPVKVGEEYNEASHVESEGSEKILESVTQVRYFEVPHEIESRMKEESLEAATTDIGVEKILIEETNEAKGPAENYISSEKIRDEDSHFDHTEKEIIREELPSITTHVIPETTKSGNKSEVARDQETQANKNIHKQSTDEDGVVQGLHEDSTADNKSLGEEEEREYTDEAPIELNPQEDFDELDSGHTKTEVKCSTEEVLSSEVVFLQHEKDRGLDDQEYSIEKKSKSQNADINDSSVVDIPGAKGVTENIVSKAEHEGVLHESTKDSEINEKSSTAVEINKEVSIAADSNTLESLMDREKPDIRPVETACEENEASRGFSPKKEKDNEDKPGALSPRGAFKENSNIQKEEEHEQQHSVIGMRPTEDSCIVNDAGSNKDEEAKEKNEDQATVETRGGETKLGEADSQSSITEREDQKIHYPDVKLESLSPPEQSSTDICHIDEPLDLAKPTDIAPDTLGLNKASLAAKEIEIPEEAQPSESTEVIIPSAGKDAQLLQKDPAVTTVQDETQKLETENDPNAASESAKVESEGKETSDEPKEMDQESSSIKPAKHSESDLMQSLAEERETSDQLAEDHVSVHVNNSNMRIVQKEDQVDLSSNKDIRVEMKDNNCYAVPVNKIPVQNDPEESAEPMISSGDEDLLLVQPVSATGTVKHEIEELEHANASEAVAEEERVECGNGTRTGECGEEGGTINDYIQIAESSQSMESTMSWQGSAKETIQEAEDIDSQPLAASLLPSHKHTEQEADPTATVDPNSSTGDKNAPKMQEEAAAKNFGVGEVSRCAEPSHEEAKSEELQRITDEIKEPEGKSLPTETTNTSVSEEDTLEIAEHVSERSKLIATKDELQTENAESAEDKEVKADGAKDEEEEEDVQRRENLGSEVPLMVEKDPVDGISNKIIAAAEMKEDSTSAIPDKKIPVHGEPEESIETVISSEDKDIQPVSEAGTVELEIDELKHVDASEAASNKDEEAKEKNEDQATVATRASETQRDEADSQSSQSMESTETAPSDLLQGSRKEIVQEAEDIDSQPLTAPLLPSHKHIELEANSEIKEDSSSAIPYKKIPVRGDPEESIETVISSEDKDIQPVSVTRTVELEIDELKHVDASEAASNKDEEAKEKNKDQATVATRASETQRDEADSQSSQSMESTEIAPSDLLQGSPKEIVQEAEDIDSQPLAAPLLPSHKQIELEANSEIKEDSSSAMPDKKIPVQGAPEESIETVISSEDKDIQPVSVTGTVELEIDELKHVDTSEAAINKDEEAKEKNEDQAIVPTRASETQRDEADSQSSQSMESTEIAPSDLLQGSPKEIVQEAEDIDSQPLAAPLLPFHKQIELEANSEIKSDSSSAIPDKKIPVQGAPEESIETVISSEDKDLQPVSVIGTVELEIDELKHVDTSEAASNKDEEAKEKNEDQATVATRASETLRDEADSQSSQSMESTEIAPSDLLQGSPKKIVQEAEDIDSQPLVAPLLPSHKQIELEANSEIKEDSSSAMPDEKIPVQGAPEESIETVISSEQKDIQPVSVTGTVELEIDELKHVDTSEAASNKDEEAKEKNEDQATVPTRASETQRDEADSQSSQPMESTEIAPSDLLQGSPKEIVQEAEDIDSQPLAAPLLPSHKQIELEANSKIKKDSSSAIPDKKIPVQGAPEESIETVISSEDKDIQPVSVTGTVELEIDELKHVDASEAASNKDEEAKEKNEDQATVATRASETQRDETDIQSSQSMESTETAPSDLLQGSPKEIVQEAEDIDSQPLAAPLLPSHKHIELEADLRVSVYPKNSTGDKNVPQMQEEAAAEIFQVGGEIPRCAEQSSEETKSEEEQRITDEIKEATWKSLSTERATSASEKETLEIAEHLSGKNKLIAKTEERQSENTERAEDKEVKTGQAKDEELEGEVQRGENSGSEVPGVPLMVEKDPVDLTSNSAVPNKKIAVQGDPEESIETVISSEDKDIQPVSVTGTFGLEIDELEHVDSSEAAGSTKCEEAEESNEDQATVATRGSETKQDEADSQSSITEGEGQKIHVPDVKLESLSPPEQSSTDICHIDEPLDLAKPTEIAPDIAELHKVSVATKEMEIPEEPPSRESTEVPITSADKNVELLQKDPAITVVQDEVQKLKIENDPNAASEAAIVESEAKGATDESKEKEQESTFIKTAKNLESDLMQGYTKQTLSVAEERETLDQLAEDHVYDHVKNSNMGIVQKEEQVDLSSNKSIRAEINDNSSFAVSGNNIPVQKDPEESPEPVVSSGDEDIPRLGPLSVTVEREIEEIEHVNASEAVVEAERVECGDNARTGECGEEKGTIDDYNQIPESSKSRGLSAPTDLWQGSAKETIQEAADIDSQDGHEDINVVQHIQDSPIRTVQKGGVNDIGITQKTEELEAVPLLPSHKHREQEADPRITVNPKNLTGEKNVPQIQEAAAAENFLAGGEIPRFAEPSPEEAKCEEEQRITDEIKEATGNSLPIEIANTAASEEENLEIAENAERAEDKEVKTDEAKHEEEEGEVQRGENSGIEVPFMIEKDQVDLTSDKIITVEMKEDISSSVPEKKIPVQGEPEESIETLISSEDKDIQPVSLTGAVELENEKLKHVFSEAAAEEDSVESGEEKRATPDYKEIPESSQSMVSAKISPSDLWQASAKETTGKAEDIESQDPESLHIPTHAKGSFLEMITKDGADDNDITQDKQEPVAAPPLASEEHVVQEADPRVTSEPENSENVTQAQQEAAAENLAGGENSTCAEPSRRPAESEEEQRISDETKEAIVKSPPTETANSITSLSEKESPKVAEHVNEGNNLVTKTDELHTEKTERAEDEAVKTDEEEEGEEQKGENSGSEALVIVEASRDIDAKVSPKKSHNILSGVGSKVKHSIAKVKKAITGKHSHPKPTSPK